MLVLSTYQEMIAARNATDAHAHDYVVNDEWLLPTPLASAHCARSLHTTRNAWCFPFVCRSTSVCLSYHQQSSSPPYSQQPTAPRQTRPPLLSAGNISRSAVWSRRVTAITARESSVSGGTSQEGSVLNVSRPRHEESVSGESWGSWLNPLAIFRQYFG